MSHLKRIMFLVPLAIMLSIVQEAESALAVLKFVYQKDMSEHCRRRVMPSMFLGRHVMDSQSQILHFSQLDVPYSCFVIVRTESGSNIILVLQVAGAEDEGTPDECYGSAPSQVTVHELGETFGGYWGPLPEVVLPKNQPTAKHRYTRPTTAPTTPSIDEATTEEQTTLRTSGITSNQRTKPQKEYIRVEIPLVNVSGPFGSDPDFMRKIENYNRMNDAMRSPGVSYRSTLLPLVQFSIAHSSPAPAPHRRVGDEAVEPEAAPAPPAPPPEPLYDLQVNPAALMEDDDDATVDLEFLMGTTAPIRRTGKKFRYNVNRLRKFKKNKGRLLLFTPAGHDKSTFNPFDVYSTLNAKRITKFETKMTTRSKTESWRYIEDLLKNLKNTTLKEYTTSKSEIFKYKNISTLLQKIAEEPRHNLSAYLDPNSWMFESPKRENTTTKQEITTHAVVSSKNTTVTTTKIVTNPISTETITLPITRETVPESSTKIITTALEQTLETTIVSSITSSNVNVTSSETADNATDTTTPYHRYVTSSTGNIGIVTDGNIHDPANTEGQNTEMPNFLVELGYNTNIPRREINQTHVNNNDLDKTLSISTGAMVDRESWQNVVQVAPALTGILGRSGSPAGTQTPLHLQNSSMRNSTREKRFIYPIEIENARPHARTTLQEVATTSETIYQFSDVQDFAQLVELDDDNIYGRIALRYLDRYVGRLLFDLCDHNETNRRHVFLFNSSRIVIAINNFTMKRMTVVATPARTLMHADSRCDGDHIECQVAGARVCVDGMAACDGVPNCGAYDIYDEDRLRCGAFRGLQHSVVVAALVFLAVLLTMLYTVHYWLKRCVPKVSKAFFIYTNGSENVLYLDTIMRSPTDFDDESRLVYTSNIFDAEDLSMVIGSDNERKKSSFMKRICSLFTFRRSKVVQSTTKPDSIDIGIDPLSPYNARKPQQQSQQNVHSLADLELSRMMNKHKEDIGVQTGESLEMAQKVASNVAGALRVFSNQRKRGTEDSPRRSLDSELNLLQIIRNAKKPEQEKQTREAGPTSRKWERRASSREYSLHDVATGDEQELETTFYESSKFMPAEDSFVVPVDIHGDPKSSKKRLRFEEIATAVRNEEEETRLERRNRASVQDEPPVELETEHGGREFMRFFGGKSKRTKKKSHPSIR